MSPAAATRSYHGRAGGHVVNVIEGGRTVGELEPRLDLVSHSPTGFGWGYGGSGPAQLALAILCDALGDDERAMRLYQAYKAKHIATKRKEAPLVIYAASVRLDAAMLEKNDRGG